MGGGALRVAATLLAAGVLTLMACGSAAAAPVGAASEFAAPATRMGSRRGRTGTCGSPMPGALSGRSPGRHRVHGPDRKQPRRGSRRARTETSGSPSSGNKIGRITPTGTITEFPIPTASSQPVGIAAGPDGNLWFTEYNGDQIGRITPAGTITEFPTRARAAAARDHGRPGREPVVHRGRQHKIGRITPTGAITEFTIPTRRSRRRGSRPARTGTCGSPSRRNQIGRITPSRDGHRVPHPDHDSQPHSIAAGPDGNLWFTEYGRDKIGRITPTGTITEFPVPTANSAPYGIAAGPDGNLWFTEANVNQIGRWGLVRRPRRCARQA